VKVEYRTGDNPYKSKALSAKQKAAPSRKKPVKYSKRNEQPGKRKK
jgi:hypothetical protein